MNCNVVTVYVALKMGSIVFFFTEIDAVIHTVYYTVLIPITLTKRCNAIIVQEQPAVKCTATLMQ